MSTFTSNRGHTNRGHTKRPLMVAVLAACAIMPFASIVVLQGQSGATDPGVRGGTAGAGGPIGGMSPQETAFFNEGKRRFLQVDSVSGTVTGEPGLGLGPRFNLNSCAGCHAQPQTGGTSPFTNPQVAVATLDGATNTVPFFISTTSPVREARFPFVFNPDGSLSGRRDGGVHDLFVISGRVDAHGCTIAQPNFDQAEEAGDLIFRIPTPVFGAGLVEQIPDAVIVANRNANLALKFQLGIGGRANNNGNDGTIARFGWKAQNKSLQLFSGEAYNVEVGATNEVFQTERDETPGCVINPTPEDTTNFAAATAVGVPTDVVMFSHFMRFLAPPTPAPDTPSIVNGRALFMSTAATGCALCHSPTLHTAAASSPALSNQAVNLFSDLLVHHMGPGLADNIVQGKAGGDEFRTAPLWGLGQRIFFLHDGRTRDLMQAIQAHHSFTNHVFPDSEANAVVNKFNALTPSQKQDILNFLRSL